MKQDLINEMAGLFKIAPVFKKGFQAEGVSSIPRVTGNIEIKDEKMKVSSNKNNLNFQTREILNAITGTDLSDIFGITDSNALEIIGEVGLNLEKWPTEKHFTSWLNLAPNNKITGGKIIKTRIPKKKNYAGQVFKMAAYAIQRSNNWLAIFYHRIKAKKGAAKAIVATARKIAVIFYKMLKDKVKFDPIPVSKYVESFKNRQIRNLKRKAQQLGFQLISS